MNEAVFSRIRQTKMRSFVEKLLCFEVAGRLVFDPKTEIRISDVVLSSSLTTPEIEVALKGLKEQGLVLFGISGDVLTIAFIGALSDGD